MKLVVVNEILPDKDAQSFLRLAKLKVPDCELQWGKMFDSYEVQTFLDPKVPYVLKAGETPIFLTERKSIRGVAGHHDVEKLADGTKIPTAYISLKESRSIYGKFHYPTVVAAHKLGSILIPQRIFGKFAIWAQGMSAAFLHEIYEIVANPMLDKGSGHVEGTTLDAKGRSWFMEIADHDRTLQVWKDPVTGQDVTFGNFVWKGFYQFGYSGRRDQFNVLASSFMLGKDGYANELKPNGTTAKILA